MNQKFPDVDMPIDFVTGVDITEEILNLYRFPCRLKAGIFVLCLEGELRAMINLSEYRIVKNDFITLAPESIIQFYETSEDIKVCFAGFSSHFLNNSSQLKLKFEFVPTVMESPVISLRPDIADIYKDYFSLMKKAFVCNRLDNPEIVRCILNSLLEGVRGFYREEPKDNRLLSRKENICRQLVKLVMQHFATERKVSFYADLLHITPQHLSVTVKQASGKTVSDIIAEVVIMDAKAKLKSTDMTIQEISYSLSFPNVSFFGKYFKRYVGMSPNEYRRS